MMKIFYRSIILTSMTCCMLFWCSYAFSRGVINSSDSSDSSTEKGISSFLCSKIKKHETIKEKVIIEEELETTEISLPEIVSEDVLLDDFNSLKIKGSYSFEEGIASWYGKEYQGKITASGEHFDMNDMTAAHKNLPFGTVVEISDSLKDLSVIVRINDRGPFINGRVINLSKRAAEKLDLIEQGITEVKINIIEVKS